MKKNQLLLSLLHLSAISAVLLFTIQPIPTVGSPDTNNTSNVNNSNTEYIRTSCAATLYPDICYTTLYGYASTVQKDPARLARAAIGVSLSNARHVADYVSNATVASIHGSAAAVKDCSSMLGDAVDEISRSLKQMRRLGGGGESPVFQLSNVQTWMSAALTNEDTCADGFQDVPDGPMKADMCDRIVQVKRVTSNALALVNSYVSKDALTMD